MAWLNGQHLKKLADSDYEKLTADFYPDWIQKMDSERWKKLTRLYRPRIQTLSELRLKAACCFEEPTLDPEAAKKYFYDSPNLPKYLKDWIETLERKTGWAPAEVESLTRELAQQLGIQTGALIHPIRFALTGSAASPGLFELMELIGKETCLRRVKKLLAFGS